MRCCDCEFRKTCSYKENDKVAFSRCHIKEQLLNKNPMTGAYGKRKPKINPFGELEGLIHTKCGVEVSQESNYCPSCGKNYK